jgi:GNAT superfamily N-acetyltransferase
MAIELERTTGADPRSLAIRTQMDDETFAKYSADFEAMDDATRELTRTALATDQLDLVEVLLALDDGVVVGHAALRPLDAGGYEVKKVYVVPEARGRGLSRTLMAEIESVARELGATVLPLQTGPKQLEAIGLYEALGYVRIGPFGPYIGLDSMVFFEKEL